MAGNFERLDILKHSVYMTMNATGFEINLLRTKIGNNNGNRSIKTRKSFAIIRFGMPNSASRVEYGIFTKKNIYLNVPNFTINPRSTERWMSGEPFTYFSSNLQSQQSVIVCDSLLDLWLLWQYLYQDIAQSKLLLICSTHEEIVPRLWSSPKYWEKFKTVYFLHKQPKSPTVHFSDELINLENQMHKRIVVPEEKAQNWSEFFSSDTDTIEFKRLLELNTSKRYQNNISSVTYDFMANRTLYDPIDVIHSSHNGHLYYPIKITESVIETVGDTDNQKSVRTTFRHNVMLIKSDRSVVHIIEEPAPRGTPPSQRVLRLSDGTVIDKAPTVPVKPTWTIDSIDSYLGKRSQIRSLADILNEIWQILRESIWLPHALDYWLLTFLTPVTFSQQFFDAVPLVLVTGPPGTGKSKIGEVMSHLCCNSQIIGQASLASIAHQIDQSSGLFILDDLESIGTSKNRQNKVFNDFVQLLKLSYKKNTAWRSIVESLLLGRSKRLSLFGVKIINNTRGSDEILGSRMIKIRTERSTPEFAVALKQRSFDSSITDRIRNDLHVWTFENHALIKETYHRLFSSFSDRESEIIAPLKVFAELCDDPVLLNNFNKSILAMNSPVTVALNSLEIALEAAKSLIRSGYTSCSATLIQEEIQKLISTGAYSTVPGDDHWKTASWIGSQLSFCYAKSEKADKRVFYKNQVVRLKAFSPDFLAAASQI